LTRTWLQFRIDVRNLLTILYYELFDLISYLAEKNKEKLLELEEELKGF